MELLYFRAAGYGKRQHEWSASETWWGQSPFGFLAFSGSGSLGARALELGVELASGVGRWEPEVQSWTLRSGVKAGVGRARSCTWGQAGRAETPGPSQSRGCGWILSGL